MDKTPIPTIYAGVRFRSRLEARWAAFFDLAGWKWEYEPAVELGYWIPDFVILGRDNDRLYVEVKPIEWGADEADWQKQVETHPDLVKVKNSGCSEVLILGSRPIYSSAYWNNCIGVFISGYEPSHSNEHSDGEDDSGDWIMPFDITILYGGYPPYKYDIAAAYGSFHYRMGGEYDGDHHLQSLADDELELNWRMAGNVTQWRK